MIIQQLSKEEILKKERKFKRFEHKRNNKNCISKALEKARDSARKDKCSGMSSSVLSKHIPRENHDGTLLKLVIWRDSPVEMWASAYQLALAEIEATTEKVLVPFVFCLSDKLISEAHNGDSGMAAYVYKRLKDSLKQTLNRDKDDMPELWFSFELAKQKHYHIQGAVALCPHEIEKAKKAFYKIYGEVTDDIKSNVLRFRYKKRLKLIDTRGQLAVDLNWALYNTKEAGEIKRDQHSEHIDTKAGRPVEDPIKIERGESMVSASNGLTKRAKQLHADLLIQFNTPQPINAPYPNWGSW